MTRKFAELQAKLSPAARARSETRYRQMLKEVAEARAKKRKAAKKKAKKNA